MWREGAVGGTPAGEIPAVVLTHANQLWIQQFIKIISVEYDCSTRLRSTEML